MWIYCPRSLLSSIVLCVLSPLSSSISESLVHVTVVAGPPVEIQVNTESIILKLDMVTSPSQETERHYDKTMHELMNVHVLITHLYI